MTMTTNEFKATGIKGIQVSWRQDVKPLLYDLKVAGVRISIDRNKYPTPKGYAYFYEVWVDHSGAAAKSYFKTNSVAAVWTYLKGLVDAEERMPAKQFKNDKNTCVIPSEAYLKDLIRRSIFGDVTDAERDKVKWYDGIVTEAQDCEVIPTYSGPTDWGQWVKDLQIALLYSKNITALQQWEAENK